MIVKATPATRNRTTPVANVIGDSNITNRPNTTSHIGTIAVRLKSIDMVSSFFLDILRITRSQDGPGRPFPRLAAARSCGYLDLDLLRLGFLT